MKKRAEGNSRRVLTQSELELMHILWTLDGGGTVAEVLDRLPEERNPAYTTVSTLLRILEQKGVVKASKQGRQHVYVPQVSRAEYEATAVRHVVENVFEGGASGLVLRLLELEDLPEHELEQIRALVQRHSKDRRR